MNEAHYHTLQAYFIAIVERTKLGINAPEVLEEFNRLYDEATDDERMAFGEWLLTTEF